MEAETVINNALEIQNLNGGIGKFSLTNISLALEPGTVMGLVGKNGAGKTTLIQTIINMIPKRSGQVLFDGVPMFGNEKTVKAKIGVVFDSLIFPTNQRPVKIKNVLAPFYETFDHERFDRLMRRFELDPKKKLSAYSRGMQMKFGAVMALCHHPDLIILDEPTAGLDPVARADLIDLLQEELQSEEKSILFSTHITSDLDKIADVITLIDNGKIIFTKNKDELLDEYTIVRIEKEQITDALKRELTGLRESPFAFEGLSCNGNKLTGVDGVRVARATIDDIMRYLTGKKNSDDE
jgi:ABC-2 type transport system ATP-binding protein